MPEDTFGSSRKVQLVLLTAGMALVPMLLSAAMVFVGKLDVHTWVELSWKLFTAGIGAPGTAAIVMRGVEGYAAKRDVPPSTMVAGHDIVQAPPAPEAVDIQVAVDDTPTPVPPSSPPITRKETLLPPSKGKR